jgi:hypothetical protein
MSKRWQWIGGVCAGIALAGIIIGTWASDHKRESERHEHPVHAIEAGQPPEPVWTTAIWIGRVVRSIAARLGVIASGAKDVRARFSVKAP